MKGSTCLMIAVAVSVWGCQGGGVVANLDGGLAQETSGITSTSPFRPEVFDWLFYIHHGGENSACAWLPSLMPWAFQCSRAWVSVSICAAHRSGPPYLNRFC